MTSAYVEVDMDDGVFTWMVSRVVTSMMTLNATSGGDVWQRYLVQRLVTWSGCDV